MEKEKQAMNKKGIVNQREDNSIFGVFFDEVESRR